MRIVNNRAYDIFLGWVGKFGKLILKNPGFLDIDDSYSQNEGLRLEVASGDLTVTSFTADPLDYVVQDELGPVTEQERSGKTPVPLGSAAMSIAFLPVFTSSNYSITYTFVNDVDPAPLHKTCMFKNLAVGGFDVDISNPAETANYVLHWSARVNV